MSIVRRRGFSAFALASAAVAWAAALLVVGLVAPVYSDGQTLTQANGSWVLVPISVPLVLAVVGWLVLRLLCTGRRRAEQGAIAVAVLLGLFCLVGAASIGLLVVPVVLLFTAAFALTPRRS